MQIRTYIDRQTMSGAAARRAARALREAIGARGGARGPQRGSRAGDPARIIAATGASQFAFLDALTAAGYRLDAS